MDSALISTVGVAVACISCFFTIWWTTKKDNSATLAEKVAGMLMAFKDVLIKELRSEFVDCKSHNLELQLLRKDIDGLNQGYLRNREYIELLFKRHSSQPHNIDWPGNEKQ